MSRHICDTVARVSTYVCGSMHSGDSQDSICGGRGHPASLRTHHTTGGIIPYGWFAVNMGLDTGAGSCETGVFLRFSADFCVHIGVKWAVFGGFGGVFGFETAHACGLVTYWVLSGSFVGYGGLFIIFGWLDGCPRFLRCQPYRGRGAQKIASDAPNSPPTAFYRSPIVHYRPPIIFDCGGIVEIGNA